MVGAVVTYILLQMLIGTRARKEELIAQMGSGVSPRHTDSNRCLLAGSLPRHRSGVPRGSRRANWTATPSLDAVAVCWRTILTLAVCMVLAGLVAACGPRPRAAASQTLLGAMHSERGFDCIQEGDYVRAIEEFSRAIELKADLAEAYNGRGLAHRRLREYDQAIADYDRAIVLRPSYAMAHYNRGLVYYYLGQYAQAIEDYDRALQLGTPDDGRVYCDRGLAYHELRQYEQALENYNQAVALRPDYAVAYNNRGATLLSLKEYRRAAEDYGWAIALEPDYAAPYFGRGLAHIALGQRKEAEHDLEQFLKLSHDIFWRLLAQEHLGALREGSADESYHQGGSPVVRHRL
jgi:tetratricopeptide (TPR) repeat protein